MLSHASAGVLGRTLIRSIALSPQKLENIEAITKLDLITKSPSHKKVSYHVQPTTAHALQYCKILNHVK